jgi:hypothetical protein
LADPQSPDNPQKDIPMRETPVGLAGLAGLSRKDEGPVTLAVLAHEYKEVSA